MLLVYISYDTKRKKECIITWFMIDICYQKHLLLFYDVLFDLHASCYNYKGGLIFNGNWMSRLW